MSEDYLNDAPRTPAAIVEIAQQTLIGLWNFVVREQLLCTISVLTLFCAYLFLSLIRARAKANRLKKTLHRSRDSLQSFLQITNLDDAGAENRINQALQVGAEFLDMEVGVYLELRDQWETIFSFPSHVCPRHSVIEDLATFSLSQPECGGAIGPHAVSVSVPNWLRTLDEKAICYAVSPVRPENRNRGLVVFYSTSKHIEPFLPEDMELLSLLGQFLGAELSQKESQKKLSASQSRMLAFISAVDDMACELDLDGNIRFLWSMSGFAGIHDEDVQNHSCLNVFGSDADRKFRDACRNAINQNRPVVFEFRGGGRIASNRHFSARVSPALEPDGTPSAIACLIRDTTQQKVAEINYRRVVRRQSYREMAVGIASEINDPLQIILGHARQLEMKFAKDEETDAKKSLRKNVHKIKEMTGRIALIVDQLQRMTSEQQRQTFELVPVGDIIYEMYRLFQARFSGAGIRFQIDSNLTGDQLLRCRPNRIKEAIFNIFHNSLTATENLAEKWIQLDAAETDQCIEISVTDSSPNPSQQGDVRVSELNFRSTSDSPTVGLAICLQIIEEHGGQLFYDTASKHSRLTMSLPKSASAALEKAG